MWYTHFHILTNFIATENFNFQISKLEIYIKRQLYHIQITLKTLEIGNHVFFFISTEVLKKCLTINNLTQLFLNLFYDFFLFNIYL